MLPFVIFGLMCALGAMAVLPLPLNQNDPLPEEFDEVEMKSRSNAVFARDAIGGLFRGAAPQNA